MYVCLLCEGGWQLDAARQYMIHHPSCALSFPFLFFALHNDSNMFVSLAYNVLAILRVFHSQPRFNWIVGSHAQT
jgi:hypothetical protein